MIVNKEKPHVVAINGWSEGWSNGRHTIDSVLDHGQFAVSYIVDAAGHRGLSPAARDSGRVRLVDDIQDVAALAQACAELASRFGPVFRLLAVSEWDILNAAKLRDRFGIAGLRAEQAVAVRDKVRMKTVVGQAGFRVPAYQACADIDQLRRFAQRHGYPVVLKPRNLMGGRGVKIIRSAAQLASQSASFAFDDQECEVFHQGTSFHVDGLVQAGQLVYAIVFRNNRPPISFSGGQALGAVSLPPGPLHDKLLAFSVAVACSLSLFDTHFHLELILDETVEHAVPVFLEVGARVGGADIPAAIELLTGVDPIRQQLRVELGQPPLPSNRDSRQCAAYLMIPFPQNLPCRITSLADLSGSRLPTLRSALRRPPGDILDGSGGFKKIPARFLLLGEFDAVQADLHALDSGPTYHAEPVSP